MKDLPCAFTVLQIGDMRTLEIIGEYFGRMKS